MFDVYLGIMGKENIQRKPYIRRAYMCAFTGYKMLKVMTLDNYK